MCSNQRKDKREKRNAILLLVKVEGNILYVC
jgi:hypothetical protein